MIIFGGLPSPVGGVTTFLSRLLYRDRKKVSHFIDVYPSTEKRVPLEFNGSYSMSSKILGFMKVAKLSYSEEVVFFNFSRLSLMLFALFFLPKGSNSWHLMLHHGTLRFGLGLGWIYSKLLLKFDVVYAINDVHYEFYKDLGVESRLKRSSSYVKYTNLNKPSSLEANLQRDVSNARAGNTHVFCCSGYLNADYKLHEAIDAVLKREDSAIFVCTYGKGSHKDYFKEFKSESRVFFYHDLSEGEFNSILSVVDCYLRPNSKDSFGIAVADAIEFGKSVIASDVCTRYKGAFLFDYRDISEFYNLVSGYPLFNSHKVNVSTSCITMFECHDI